jgi:hypothetical protein
MKQELCSNVMGSKKLSKRAIELLLVVDENTEKDSSTGKLERYFVPRSSMYYLKISADVAHRLGIDTSFYIFGASDASSFKGLQRNGYIERPNTGLDEEFMQKHYYYAVTEKGRLAVESLLGAAPE